MQVPERQQDPQEVGSRLPHRQVTRRRAEQRICARRLRLHSVRGRGLFMRGALHFLLLLLLLFLLVQFPRQCWCCSQLQLQPRRPPHSSGPTVWQAFHRAPTASRATNRRSHTLRQLLVQRLEARATRSSLRHVLVLLATPAAAQEAATHLNPPFGRPSIELRPRLGRQTGGATRRGSCWCSGWRHAQRKAAFGTPHAQRGAHACSRDAGRA